MALPKIRREKITRAIADRREIQARIARLDRWIEVEPIATGGSQG